MSLKTSFQACLVVLLLSLMLVPAGRAPAASIIWVSRGADAASDADDLADDQPWIDLLTAKGHTVDYRPRNWEALDAGKEAELAAADLVIFSRGANSGDHDDGTEPAYWNGLQTPVMLLGSVLARGGASGTVRWHWINDGGNPDNDPQHGAALMEVLQPGHPIFNGISLDMDNKVDVLVPDIEGSVPEDFGIHFLLQPDAGNGNLLAKVDSLSDDPTPNAIWIAHWAPSAAPYFPGGTHSPGGHRLYFLAGSGHDQMSPRTYEDGSLNFNTVGQQMFCNAVDFLLTIPEPASMSLLCLSCLIVLGVRRRA